MDFMEASDLVTALLALAALVVSCFAWWSSHRSAVAAEDAAKSAKRSAAAEEAQLEFERQDRAAAELERRTNVWSARMATMAHIEFTFRGVEAHHVLVEAQGELLPLSRPKGGTGPMFNRHRVMAKLREPERWNRVATIAWAESDEEGAELLRKELPL